MRRKGKRSFVYRNREEATLAYLTLGDNAKRYRLYHVEFQGVTLFVWERDRIGAMGRIAAHFGITTERIEE
jgi:hypothetical protein